MCRFHRALAYPEPVGAGLRVAKLGRSSVRYEIGLFSPGEDEPAATGHFVHVFVERATRRPAELPPAIRAALALLCRLSRTPSVDATHEIGDFPQSLFRRERVEVA